jgi:hypothetical protein
LVGVAEEGHPVVWNEREIVIWIKLCNLSCYWERLRFVVDEPASDVILETVSEGIEEILDPG